jgi:hypothetical protein
LSWPYSPLHLIEQYLLKHPGVFVGGFDMSAVEQERSDDEPLA